MRVSTSQIFDSGTVGIQRNQGGLFKLQNQLSTGRRVLTPADDPVSSAQALVVAQSKEVNDQYLENQGTARAYLNAVDSKLGSVGDELQSIFERTIQAGNDALSPQQRGMIATELKARLENITSLANSQDGEGLYIFSGFQAQTQPFQATANLQPFSLGNQSVGYFGDGGQRKLQVSASQDMAISNTGAEVFMQVRDGNGNLTGKSVFDTVKNLINILDPTSGVPFTQAAYQTAVGEVTAAVDNVSRVRSTVGSRLASLESLGTASQDMDLQYQERLSNLQDLDYAKAISDLSRKQMQLEAAQKSFAQTSQLTLFNVI